MQLRKVIAALCKSSAALTNLFGMGKSVIQKSFPFTNIKQKKKAKKQLIAVIEPGYDSEDTAYICIYFPFSLKVNIKLFYIN